MMQPAPTVVTEWSDSRWGLSMTSRPEIFQDDTEAGLALAIELEKAQARQKKLEEALYKSFPLELYKQARPDVEEDYDGMREQIIEHYVENDINKIDFKKESQKIKYSKAIRL